MRIVILRHAEVDFEWSRLCSSKKFDSECSSYDSSPIKEIVLSKPQIRYEKKYISELSRSRDTAKMVFPNEDYIRSELIKEIKKAGFKTNNPSVVYKNGECIMAEK